MKRFLHAFLASLVAFGSLLLIPATPAVAAADTCTWTGANSGDWSDGGNWTGCDNGGVPETGDDLLFPGSPTTPVLNNDLAIIPRDIRFDAAYTVNGNTMELSRTLTEFGGSDYNSIVRFSASSGAGQLNIQGGSPSFNLGIDLNLTGGADFYVFTSNSNVDLPVITGSVDSVIFQGNPTAPVEVYSSSTSPSTFIANSIAIWRSGFNCQSDNCLGDDSNPIAVEGADSGTQAFLRLNSAGLMLANPITFDDTGVLVGPSRLEVVQGATTTGTITVTDDATIAVAASTSLLLNGSVALGSNSTLTYTVGSGGQITHNGSVSGAGNIVVDGYVFMVNANSYSGSTNVNSGAILIIANASGLGTTAGVTTVNSGGTLEFNPFVPISVAEDISVSGNGRPGASGALEIYNATDDVTLTGNITLIGDTTIGQGLSGTANFIFDGPISGTGNVTINGFNTSDFTFGSNTTNSYVGSTTVTGGQLYLSKFGGTTAIPGDLLVMGSPSASATVNETAFNQIADTSNVVLTTNIGLGTLLVGLGDQVATVTGNGDISLAGGSYLIQSSSSNSTFSGQIFKSSAGVDPQFIKEGTGTTTLDGSVVDYGVGLSEFVVNGGKLLSNADYTNTAFAANTGGTIGGSGSAGVTTVNSGGHINVGNSPGCMTVASLNLTAGANFDEELAGTTACTEYDRTTVTGAANLNNAVLNVIPTFTPSAGTVFTIIQAGNVVGTFNGLADGATFSVNGIQFRINYTNSQVNLTVLGGSLVPTGQNHNGIAYLAGVVMLLGLGGLFYTLRRDKFTFKRSIL